MSEFQGVKEIIIPKIKKKRTMVVMGRDGPAKTTIMQLGDREYTLGGTSISISFSGLPGFYEPPSTDWEILSKIATFVISFDDREVRLRPKMAGVIYVHDVQLENEAKDSSNFEMMREIVGKDGYKHLIGLVNKLTSQDASQDQAVATAERPFTRVWRHKIGSDCLFPGGTEDVESVFQSQNMKALVQRTDSLIMELQKDLCDGKTLGRTAAGKKLSKLLGEEREKIEKKINEIQKKERRNQNLTEDEKGLKISGRGRIGELDGEDQAKMEHYKKKKLELM